MGGKKLSKLLGVAVLTLLAVDAILDIACIVQEVRSGAECEGCMGCCRDTGDADQPDKDCFDD